MRMLALPAALAAALIAAPVLADAPPPANAKKLSDIIASVEAEAGAKLAYIDSVDWDDDGYYEVEYHTADGKKVKVKLDPITGAARN